LSSRDLSNSHMSGSVRLIPIHNRPLIPASPFLCPHVTCQTVMCQAQSGSPQSTTGRSLQPHSRPLALLSWTPFLPLSLKKHVTLFRYQPFTFSCLNATLSQDSILRLLSLLSLLAPCLLILTPRRSLAFLHSFCLRTSLTHVAPFSHVVVLSF